MCWDAPRTHAFVPCGHRCTCEACVQIILAEAENGHAECPMCRAIVTQALKVFL